MDGFHGENHHPSDFIPNLHNGNVENNQDFQDLNRNCFDNHLPQENRSALQQNGADVPQYYSMNGNVAEEMGTPEHAHPNSAVSNNQPGQYHQFWELEAVNPQENNGFNYVLFGPMAPAAVPRVESPSFINVAPWTGEPNVWNSIAQMELADRPPLLRTPYWQVGAFGGEPYMPDPTPWEFAQPALDILLNQRPPRPPPRPPRANQNDTSDLGSNSLNSSQYKDYMRCDRYNRSVLPPPEEPEHVGRFNYPRPWNLGEHFRPQSLNIHNPEHVLVDAMPLSEPIYMNLPHREPAVDQTEHRRYSQLAEQVPTDHSTYEQTLKWVTDHFFQAHLFPPKSEYSE